MPNQKIWVPKHGIFLYFSPPRGAVGSTLLFCNHLENFNKPSLIQDRPVKSKCKLRSFITSFDTAKQCKYCISTMDTTDTFFGSISQYFTIKRRLRLPPILWKYWKSI